LVTAGVGLGEGATRILAGRHFYTDVAAGMAAGTAIGTLIPYLHERNKHATVSITPEVSPESVQLVFRKDF
jgi:membrane-associated phospholipid phosphatase